MHLQIWIWAIFWSKWSPISYGTKFEQRLLKFVYSSVYRSYRFYAAQFWICNDVNKTAYSRSFRREVWEMIAEALLDDDRLRNMLIRSTNEYVFWFFLINFF